MNKMNGADRIQLYFDQVSRKNTGCGNLIRMVITIDGVIPAETIRKRIDASESFQFLAAAKPVRKWYSPVYRWQQVPQKKNEDLVSFHRVKNFDDLLPELFSQDCDFHKGAGIHVDVLHDESSKTCIMISANHSTLDYHGMENLVRSFAGDKPDLIIDRPEIIKKSFLKKFSDSIRVTQYVASLSSRNFIRLRKRHSVDGVGYESITFPGEESVKIKNRLEQEAKTNAMAFFLAASAFTIGKTSDLLTGNKKFFIVVPVNRRSVVSKEVVFSNHLSFVYFGFSLQQAVDIYSLSALFSKQLIQQAKLNIPEKFMSLLYLFRFLPPWIYRLWLELPTNGHSASFAFSLLPPSFLEKETFMTFPVLDVNHLPPVISPPGLNIVITEFRGRQKIIFSFDKSRIRKEDVTKLMFELKTNLLN